VKTILAPLVRVLLICACFVTVEACVDTSPIDYHAPSTQDAGPSDAAPVSADAARVVECRQCVTKDACTAEYTKCTADPRCEAFMGCLLDAYCLNFPSDLTQLPACLVTCGVQTGIKSGDDPVIALFRPVLFCAQDHCAMPCGVSTM